METVRAEQRRSMMDVLRISLVGFALVLSVGGQFAIAENEPDRSMGLDPEVAAKIDFDIPRDKDIPMFSLPPGHAVTDGSLRIICAGGGALSKSADRDPAKGAFSLPADALIVFSKADGGSRVRILYRARPRRVALLPVFNRSSMDYLPGAAQKGIEVALRDAGFALISPDRVTVAAKVWKITADQVLSAATDPDVVSSLASFSKDVDAAYVLACLVDAGQRQNGAGVVLNTYSATPYGGSGVGIVVADQFVGAFMAVAFCDGSSGRTLAIRDKAGEHRRDTAGDRRVRQRIVENLSRDVLFGYFGAPTKPAGASTARDE